MLRLVIMLNTLYSNSNDKDPEFQVGDHVRISKYRNIFAKGYIPNWSEEIFVIKKVKKYSTMDKCY